MSPREPDTPNTGKREPGPPEFYARLRRQTRVVFIVLAVLLALTWVVWGWR